ncbi:tyrosine-type recombinase/integrase [Ruminococcus albus]|uniref:Site-specific recombinase XerD n=1 Tax=Ruminococcus albus TaxID=1264 RepID=A0A1I1QKB0_RUMAL|nr:tyrosine-type recombinase/integrase [Ruminococcus albus]SFD18540.1 Site-specific recombinase XerD [Ruminococcus albus]SFD33054.1 Site-specific recombinase XerD [Ruminococcus albus]
MSGDFSFYVQRYFMSYLMKQHNYGQNTISSYRDTFRLLLTFMSESNRDISKKSINEIDYEMILEFLTWLSSVRNNGISTKNVRLAHLKSFFRYVMMISPEHSWQCSKILGIPFGKEDKKTPACMSMNGIKQILSSIDASSDEGLRHLAILSLLYDSACRVQEIIALNVMDFQPGRCCRIYVHGKGNKHRSVPLLDETEKIVSKYIRQYRLTPESPLFCNRKGDRLTRQGIRYIIRKYSKIANETVPGIIDGSVYPHRMRHSKATHLVDNGVNIYNVRDFLGHESIATTQVYLTTNPEVTRKAIESIAKKTVPESLDFFSEEKKDDLLSFLDALG